MGWKWFEHFTKYVLKYNYSSNITFQHPLSATEWESLTSGVDVLCLPPHFLTGAPTVSHFPIVLHGDISHSGL